MLLGLVIVLHVVICLVLIGVVLLQTGKRADLAGAFGGGGSQTAFGTRGAATVLSKATTICAVLFMFTSVGLSILSYRDAVGTDRSVLEQVPAPTTESAPADTGAVPPAAADTPPATTEDSDAPVEDDGTE
jgi:preprotein translocase subunit SecG